MVPEINKNICAWVFDVYGTLFDLDSITSGIRQLFPPGGVDADAFSDMWRARQLQYAWLRSLTGHYTHFDQVTMDALNFTLNHFQLSGDLWRDSLMALYQKVKPYPEVLPTLKQLKKRGTPLVLLSNGTPESLSMIVSRAGLSSLFDAVLSVDSVRVYKPHPMAYRMATDHLSLRPDQIGYVSSNGWDAFSAKAFGFWALWCNRMAHSPEFLPQQPDAVIRNLTELAKEQTD